MPELAISAAAAVGFIALAGLLPSSGAEAVIDGHCLLALKGRSGEAAQ